MKINIINNNNILFLEKFLKSDIPKSFRYFNKRDITSINNHKITIIGIIDTPDGKIIRENDTKFIKPSDNEIIQNNNKIEGGCYW